MRVCVYCGSSPGIAPMYVENARAIGRGLAERGIGLVYGGAHRGTMGALADACLEAGGEVIGVIPKVLVEAEIAHTGLTRLHVVADMHERKAKMAELADAFVALPGGAGTMEEIFEAWTWAQLGLHEKRCVLQNLGGYYDGLVTQIERMVHEGMMRADVRAMLLVTTSSDETLQAVQK